MPSRSGKRRLCFLSPRRPACRLPPGFRPISGASRWMRAAGRPRNVWTCIPRPPKRRRPPPRPWSRLSPRTRRRAAAGSPDTRLRKRPRASLWRHSRFLPCRRCPLIFPPSPSVPGSRRCSPPAANPAHPIPRRSSRASPTGRMPRLFLPTPALRPKRTPAGISRNPCATPLSLRRRCRRRRPRRPAPLRPARRDGPPAPHRPRGVPPVPRCGRRALSRR